MSKLHELWEDMDNSLFNELFVYPEFLTTEDRQKIDSIFETQYMDINIYSKFAKNIAMLKTSIVATLFAHEYTLKGLKESMSFNYNPIENYDRFEESTSEKGTQTNTNTKGVEESHYIYDAQTNTNQYDDVVVNTSNGERLLTTTTGERITTNSTTGFNSDSELTDGKSVQSSYVDKEKNNAVTDTQTTNARTDTSTISAHTDSVSVDERVDSLVEGERTDKFFSHIHGNIGVRSGQELTQQWRDVVMFNFYAFICETIRNTISINVWE